MKFSSIIILTVLICFQQRLRSQNVNPFNGSLNYNYKLLTIPAHHGPDVSVNATYFSGIKVNQQASEIGLGWGIDAGGAIYRSVSGFPDDMKPSWFYDLSDNTVTNVQGALYPATDGTISIGKYDVLTASKGYDTTQFMMPDYDNYFVSAPGLQGRMKINYYKFYKYTNTPSGSKEEYYPTIDSYDPYYRKPQFHFVKDFHDTLISRHYPSVTTPTTSFLTTTSTIAGNGYTSSAEPYIGKHLSNTGTLVTNQNFDLPTGRLATSNFVEYFTNAEIDAANTGSFASGPLVTFIDYKSSHDRSTFPQEGIGAFRVTTPDGLTYHYSLPVYQLLNTVYRSPLNNDYSMTGLSTSDFNTGNFYNLYPGGTNTITIRLESLNKYAIKWLLTAVTGPDYVDANKNHVADTADAGYWIRYDYQKWSDGFAKRSPHYGYDYGYEPDASTQHYPTFFPVTPNATGNPYKLSGLYGVANLVKAEVYHLSKVKTCSHIALFVRGIRLDEKEITDQVSVGSGFKSAPDLSLKHILLYKNEQYDSLIGAAPIYTSTPVTFSTGSYPQFSFTNVTNNAYIYTSDWFDQKIASPDGWIRCILQHIEFDQDYSLCKNYHGNVNVNCVGSSVLTPPATVESSISVSTYSTSGKLTLNRILTYGNGNVKLVPSLKFGYPTNPDFVPRKADYWNYYKSDATQDGYSGYTTVSSKDNVNAWCLQTITNPLGGETQIQYESNQYNKVVDQEASGGVRGPVRIYRIKNVNMLAAVNATTAQTFSIQMEEGSSVPNLVTEFAGLASGTLAGQTTRIILPYHSASCNNNTSCLTGNKKGFVNGICSLSIITGTSGSTDNVTGTISVPGGSDKRHAESFNYTNKYTGSNAFVYSLVTASTSFVTDVAYSGNGFIMFEMPTGTDVYGGGVRVKKIISRNPSTSESYETSYEYSDGALTYEMDRFDWQVMKKYCGGSQLRYNFLTPKSFDRFTTPPMQGYSKVTVKNLGLINTANGKKETQYITDPSYKSGAFANNFAVTSYTSEVTGGATYELKTINECQDQFSNAFGLPTEEKVYDKNDNVLKRTVYEYESPTQGSLVENFFFENLYHFNNYPTTYSASGYSNAYSYSVNILRELPVRAKSMTTYSMGLYSKTENIYRDEVTGDVRSSRLSSKNQSNLQSYRLPAYTYYQANAAIDFTTAAFRQALPLSSSLFTYGSIDSTLASGTFLTAGYKLFSKNVKQRKLSGNIFTTITATLPSYFNNRSFTYDGGPGSMNQYGLFDKSALSSHTMNLAASTASLYWEPAGTTYWRLLNEVTLIDTCKNIMEVRDANNRFSASRFGYDGYYKTASVSNCNYASFTFAGFETVATGTGVANMDGDIVVNSHSLIPNTTVLPHTGLNCIKVTSVALTFTAEGTQQSPGNTLDLGLMPGRVYRTSVWTHTTNSANAVLSATIMGNLTSPSLTAYVMTYSANVATNSVTQIGNWILLQFDIDVPESFTCAPANFKIQMSSANNSTVYFDDFILHPVESEFSANVYNLRNGQLMSTLDENGLATNYFYDAIGRITEIWKEVPFVGYKKVKKHSYNYARGAND
jgi:hypothetical protein